MAIEQTLSIIKPNAIGKNVIGKIINQFEDHGLKVAAAKMLQLTTEQCEQFYAEHKKRPFFDELVRFMTSGPVVVMCLSGDNAILKNREIMGATNPAEAKAGTIRAQFGDNVGENAVHGSDSLESAKRELELFFEQWELVNP